MSEETDVLNDRQRRFVAGIARGLSAQQAGVEAGWSESYSRKASKLLKCAPIAKELAEIQAAVRTVAVYDVVAAMREADSAARFAREHKNPNALVKACELRAKLSGLLIDRVEVVSIDLSGSLAQAAQRVIHHNPALKQLLQADANADQPAGDRFTYCGPGQKDNPFGTD